MTTEQEKIAEQIIQLHKENGGVVDNDLLHSSINFSQSMDSITIIDHLKMLGLLVHQGPGKYFTQLTPKGERFISFNEQRRREAEGVQRTQELDNLHLKDLRGNIRGRRFSWLWMIIASIVSGVVGALVGFLLSN